MTSQTKSDFKLAIITLITAVFIGFLAGRASADEFLDISGRKRLQRSVEDCNNAKARICGIMSGDATVVFKNRQPYLYWGYYPYQENLLSTRKIEDKEWLNILEGCYE